MLSLDLPQIRKILCLGAHPDDIEIGCGGTILKLVQQNPNLEVRWVVFSGNPTRRREARQSAARFLLNTASCRVQLKQFRESFFPSQWSEIKDAFESLKRQFNPDLVFTHYRQDRHQDHRVLSDLAWNTFRNHLILEYEIPKYDGDLGNPNLFVHLSPSLCRRKTELLETGFPSQNNKHWFDVKTFQGLLRIRGMECASPSGYAEAFYGRKLLWRAA